MPVVMIPIAATVLNVTASPIAKPASAVKKNENAVVATLVATTPISLHIEMYAMEAKNMMTPDAIDNERTHPGVFVRTGATGDIARYAMHAIPTAALRMTFVPATVNGILVEMTCDVATAAE